MPTAHSAEQADDRGSSPAAVRSRPTRFRDWLRDNFFPPSERLTGRPLLVVTAVSVLFVLCSVPLLLSWRSFPTAGNIIWAEDGAIFIPEALNYSLWDMVFHPYAGYALVVPRVLASLVVTFPAADWAIGIALASIAVRSLLAVFVWHALSGALPSRLARAAISVCVVTIPLGGMEVLNNLANLHWFLLFACFPALLWRPSSWFGVTVQCLVAVAAVLSDPLALVCLPLVVLRSLSLREFREHLVSLLFVVAGALQLIVVLSTTRPRSAGLTIRETVEAYTVRVGQTAFAGVEIPQWAWESARNAGLLITVLVIGAVIVGGLLCRGPHRGLIVVTLVGSVTLYGAAIGLSSTAEVMVPLTGPINVNLGGRYAVLAGLLLLTATIAAFWAMLHRARGSGATVMTSILIAGAVALTGLYVFAAAQNHGNRVDPGALLPWPEAIAQGTTQCQQDPALQIAMVPIDPQGWNLPLWCPVIRG